MAGIYTKQEREERIKGKLMQVHSVPIAWTNVFGNDPRALPDPGDPERFGLKPPRWAMEDIKLMLSDGTVWEYRGCIYNGQDASKFVGGWMDVTDDIFGVREEDEEAEAKTDIFEGRYSQYAFRADYFYELYDAGMDALATAERWESKADEISMAVGGYENKKPPFWLTTRKNKTGDPA